MRKTVAMAMLLAGLAGCQTFENMDAGLASLRGKPYQAAFDILGFPDAETTIAGKRVFSWGRRDTGSYTVPTFDSTTAYVNGKPVLVQTQGMRTEYYDNHCRIDIIVGEGGLIEQSKYDGNTGGCERYGAALKPKKG